MDLRKAMSTFKMFAHKCQECYQGLVCFGCDVKTSRPVRDVVTLSADASLFIDAFHDGI